MVNSSKFLQNEVGSLGFAEKPESNQTQHSNTKKKKVPEFDILIKSNNEVLYYIFFLFL